MHNRREKVVQTSKRRWFQFRLRTIFVLIALSALPCAWVGTLVRRDQRTERALKVLEKEYDPSSLDYIYSGFSYWPGSRTAPNIAIRCGEWTRLQSITASKIHGLQTLGLGGSHERGALAELVEIETLCELFLHGPEFNDASLLELANVKQLRYLHLLQTNATEEGICALREALPHLEILDD